MEGVCDGLATRDLAFDPLFIVATEWRLNTQYHYHKRDSGYMCQCAWVCICICSAGAKECVREGKTERDETLMELRRGARWSRKA